VCVCVYVCVYARTYICERESLARVLKVCRYLVALELFMHQVITMQLHGRK
jgi:hypothetical protein